MQSIRRCKRALKTFVKGLEKSCKRDFKRLQNLCVFGRLQVQEIPGQARDDRLVVVFLGGCLQVGKAFEKVERDLKTFCTMPCPCRKHGYDSK